MHYVDLAHWIVIQCAVLDDPAPRRVMAGCAAFFIERTERMSNLPFDPDNTLAGGLYALSPRESILLGIGLCAAVEDAVGQEGCHGGIWPGSISFVDAQAAVGPAAQTSIKDISPDALEYIAPEQFWNGETSPASDVYSIGLVLYTALNGGILPFFSPDGGHSPEARAAALQSRMKGKDPGYPRTACRELGDVVLKAMSFRAADRYACPAELRKALEALPEGAAVPAVAPVIHLTPDEVKNTRSYKVDKNFERIDADKPLRKPQKPRGVKAVDENMDSEEFRRSKQTKGYLLPLLIIVAAIAAVLVFLLRGCSDDTKEPVPSPTPTLSATPAPVETPEPSPAETPAPDDEPDVTPTPEPSYQVILEDVTWEEAVARCEALGGHLATVRSEDELEYIISLAEDAGAQFVWLGAYRAEDGIWYYVTGETMSFARWDDGEPSAVDADGTREDYLLLWYRKQTQTWTYNDMRNDPISVIPATYSGKVAYICQFD